MSEIRLVIVDPGHFHAALIQKDMYDGVSPRASVYAPLGPELLDYLNRIARFNARPQSPTRWQLDMHAGPDFFDRMLRERPGNVVVLSGRNRGKIDRILRSLEAGCSVLADKPWIIASADLPQLASALDLAEKKNLVAYDIMTERYEITSVMLKELANQPDVFGHLESGSASEPAIRARSVHHLMKLVAGVPLRRPAWFFDISETGEALADVGTHVVDLVQWTVFPQEAIDYRADVRLLSARRWPTILSQAQFQAVTGEGDFPAALAPWVKDGQLVYYCNNSVQYTVRGAHVRLDILWNWEATEGSGDVFEASFRGSKARAEIRQGKAEGREPEVYFVPNTPALRAEVFAALRNKIRALGRTWPGLDMNETGPEAHILIPEKYRIGHEAHFAQVTNQFFEYLSNPKSLPAWERANMLAKYYISTRGVELSHREAHPE